MTFTEKSRRVAVTVVCTTQNDESICIGYIIRFFWAKLTVQEDTISET